MGAVWDIVVVGAGSAGVAAVEAAHQQNPAARILLLDADGEAPYQRTELSKHIASGFKPGQFQLYDDQWFGRNNVTLRVGDAVAALDTGQHECRLAGGDVLQYRSLVLATGAEPVYPRIVRSHEEGSFFALRTMRDAQHLIKGIASARTVLIDGMGVLALEVADQLVRMKKKPSLVGATAQLMPRQLSTRAAEIMEEVLLRNKVKLIFQDEILSFESNRKGGLDVALLRSSGVYDAVVVCIGVQPCTELAEAAGLQVERGIVVDEQLRSSDPSIYAAGDVAQHPDGSISHVWQAAEYQGRIAGSNAAGAQQVYDRRPFRLTTNVFDTHVLSMNLPRDPRGYRVEEVEADTVYQGFYFSEDRLHGVIVLNDESRSTLYSEAVIDQWNVDQVAEQLML
ncbi:MAG: NAD(P)/FAD-dependent oxidoreductase [Spirochaetaceae bacterium]|nr:MAG: NAD(P)/FAD-dependent oxidoreductase [Spirochaetaceae bacterium]